MLPVVRLSHPPLPSLLLLSLVSSRRWPAARRWSALPSWRRRCSCCSKGQISWLPWWPTTLERLAAVLER